ncbi:MAG: methyltransferase domain-containing protein [Candidatus Sungbacteria bacterium]|nr:methyltransferase domain-containing protein [Candidatus Sungbacteria bacterium]
MNLKKLNLGCGTDIKQGWINLDSAQIPGIDIVHDIEKLPLPFQNEEFNEILAQDILEHVEYIPVLKDLHRILKKSGTLTIRVPHFTSKNNYIDPTHKKRFSVNTLDFFVSNTKLGKKREYYFDFMFSEIKKRRITFERSSRVFFYNSLVEPIVNHSLKTQQFYESSSLSRLFPAENIEITLRK